MQLRQEDGPFNGYLEFPGGKIEEEESPREACLREISEEVCLDKTNLNKLAETLFFFKFYEHTYSDRTVKLHVFLAPYESSETEKMGEWVSLRFVTKSQPISNKILPANGQIIDDVMGFLADCSKESYTEDAWRQLSRSQNFF